MAVELRFVAFSGPLYAPSPLDQVGLGLRAILLPTAAVLRFDAMQVRATRSALL
jgi:hypothetical protein